MLYLKVNNEQIPVQEFSRNFSSADDFINIQIQLEHLPTEEEDIFNLIVENRKANFGIILEDNTVLNFEGYTFDRIYESVRSNGEKEFTVFFKGLIDIEIDDYGHSHEDQGDITIDDQIPE